MSAGACRGSLNRGPGEKAPSRRVGGALSPRRFDTLARPALLTALKRANRPTAEGGSLWDNPQVQGRPKGGGRMSTLCPSVVAFTPPNRRACWRLPGCRCRLRLTPDREGGCDPEPWRGGRSLTCGCGQPPGDTIHRAVVWQTIDRVCAREVRRSHPDRPPPGRLSCEPGNQTRQAPSPWLRVRPPCLNYYLSD